VVSYQILDPPGGTLTLETAELNYEMLTLLDGAPIGYKVFFESGKSEIPGTYNLFASNTQTQSFDSKNIRAVMQRYHNILNLIGNRLRANPETQIRIVGCNSGSGVEKDNLELSQKRAETVKNYLQEIWAIDDARMQIEARNIPAQPTAADVLGSRAENQRVDILFESARMETQAANEFVVESQNINALKINPRIVAGYDIASWELTILAGDFPGRIGPGTTCSIRYASGAHQGHRYL
jgi:hypothetical protein